MKIISTQIFKHTLRDIHKNTDNRKFCFVIGAGASVKSGIQTGGQLAEKWFNEIKERYSVIEIQEWIKEANIDIDDLASHYGSIYRKRFESDKTSGYEFLVQAMRSTKPTFGHIVLAQILTKTSGNSVLTTNFDSLIESSIYQYTNKTPLVVGHESLSGYARQSRIHPLIIKIHRDLLLSPKSDPDEISKLDRGWKEPLDNIFSSHIPIVIGYGGNDGSLMSYFEQMNVPSNFFWCKVRGSIVSQRVEKLIDNMGGSFVEIDGFDEIMQELLWVFDEIKPIKEELDEITKSRIEAANKQLNELNKQIKNGDLETVKEFSAYEYADLADNEINFEKRKSIYLEALKRFPKTAWLWNEFTYFMHFIKKDYSNLEEYYQKALSVDPEYAYNNCNYAIFLNDIKKDYENAEKYYIKALTIAPENADFMGNYANFLNNIKKDYESAEKYYLKALSIDPEHAFNNGSYAIFLNNVKKDFEKAEIYYIKTLSFDPENANFNGNYANFLNDIKKDHENAKKHYHKALSICPNHANNNGNYASFLSNIKKDYENAEKYFLKALLIDPKHVNNNGNYAIFLSNIKKDYEKAENYYLKALSVEPENANWLGNYAIFLKGIKKDYENADKYYLKALSVEPENANWLGNYAQLLFIEKRKSEAVKYLEKAFQENNGVKNELLVELWFYRYAHHFDWLEKAEKEIDKLLKEGKKSEGWDLSQDIKVAIEEGHPNPGKLQEFACKITKANN